MAGGILAAAICLSIGEFGAGITSKIVSPVSAVGDLIIDFMPGPVIRKSIEIFGSAQKPLLLTTISVGTFAVGAFLGRCSARANQAGLFLFGIFGAYAMIRHPLSSLSASCFLTALMLLAGSAVLRFFRDPFGISSSSDQTFEDPRRKYADRRGFLVFTSGISVASLALLLGSRVLSSQSGETVRSKIDLPLQRNAQKNDSNPTSTTRDSSLQKFENIDGMTTWITPNSQFYRIDTALSIPVIDPSEWSLQIGGLTKRNVTLNLDDLLKLNVIDAAITLACVSNEVGGSLVGNAVWTGVPLADVLEIVEPLPFAEQVFSSSVDGFEAGFPLSVVEDGRTALLAFGMNGEPLPLKHGFPVRLVVPGLYGYVSAVKWLSSIQLTRWSAATGFWIDKGWAREAPIKIASRIDVPSPRRVAAGLVPVGGIAFYPDVGIKAVQLSIDNGPWKDCRIGDSTGPGKVGEAWVQWLYLWDATPGYFNIRVRAVGTDGLLQPERPVPPAPNGAEGYHEVRILVT